MTEASNPNSGPVGGLIPHITIKNGSAAEAIAFYEKAFDAREDMRALAEDGKRLMHARLTINGAALMLNDDFPEFGVNRPSEPGGYVLHLQVDDADKWWSRALEAGCEVAFPLENQFWGDRYGQVKDPFGVYWSIGAAIK